MKADILALLRSFTSLGAPSRLRLILGSGALLCAISGTAHADPTPVEASEVTINPTSGNPLLTLQGPAFDSAATIDYGLTLTYHDSTGTDPTAYGILKIYRPTGQYQWMFNGNTSNTDRLAMRLDNGHALTLYDPAQLGIAASAIVLHPGPSTDSNSGIFWNSQRLATISEVTSSFVPLVNGGIDVGGAVTIGTSTTPSSLTVSGATTTTQIKLPATTDANTGVIYQGATPVLHTYGSANFFLGANAGNFTLNTTSAEHNIGIGVNALVNLTTGNSNVALGYDALVTDQSGSANTAIGSGAMGGPRVIDGGWNTAVGAGAGNSITTGGFNVCLGFNSFGSSDGGWGFNVAVGTYAMSNAQGTLTEDVAVGPMSLLNLNDGRYNTAVGGNSAIFVSSGSKNTLVGNRAGVEFNPADNSDPYHSLTTGNNNTFVGYSSGLASTTQHDNATAIGYMAKVDANNAMVLGGTGDNAVNVGINTTTPQTKLDVNGDATVRGVLRVPPAGDIGMGDFTAGTNPTPPQP